MSNLSQFINKININLLWDVLLDELNININNKNLISNVRTVFEGNVKPFTTKINPKTSIMDLNKQFLSQVVLAVNRLFPNIKNDQGLKKIIITDEEAFEPYKIEDIHASRQSDFDKEVERKRMELDNYMTPQKPKELDFSYNNSDGKIKAMDSLVADKLAERNLEFETFKTTIHNTSGIDPEKWLSPKETSVKGEKYSPIVTQQTNNRLKHINIDNSNIIPDDRNQKKVSWNDNNNEETSINIFQKLKRQSHIEDTPISEDITINEEKYISEQKQYVEQQSQPLPNIIQEQINRATIVQQSVNAPIIPKNEVIKQLNDMNTKIDSLYDMVSKLTNIIQELTVDKSNILDKL